MSSEPPRKRKKKSHDPNVVMLGGKPLNLAALLDEPPKRKNPEPDPKQTPTPATAPSNGNEPHASTSPELSHHRNSLGSFKNRPGRGTYGKGTLRDSRWKENPVLLKTRQKLPIWAYRDTIRGALTRNDTLVVVGETGSGKSTQIPQFLYQEPWCQRRKAKVPNLPEPINVGGIIAVTQPRRVAATTLAHRVAQEAGSPLGRPEGLVGYSVRFDHNVPKGTKIKFLTEGMLLQELLQDPYLRQYSAVIVDEIHERSVDVDLLSGFLKKIRIEGMENRGGVPLKVVIMSATADVDEMKDFFSESTPSEEPCNQNKECKKNPSKIDFMPAEEQRQVEVLHVKGRQFPVDLEHTTRPVNDLQDQLLKTVFRVHTEEPFPGDILAFMTGQEDIEAAVKLIEEYGETLAPNVPRIKAFPLFGQMSMEAQHAAFQPLKEKYTRKVVLATNIAETSVTVPGVRYVIDCGKAKVKQFRTRLGMESLLAKPISMSSAIQRAGRAGREGPGKCFRLYTQETFDSLEERDLPEILRTDLVTAILTMKAYGIDDIQAFPLIDMPEVEALEHALMQLCLIGAIDKVGHITEEGRKISKLPVSPTFGVVLLNAAKPEFDCLLEVIDIISCITSGEDIFQHIQTEEVREEVEEMRKQLFRREGDLITLLTTMQLYASENTDRTTWCQQRRINMRNMRQAMKIRKQLRGLAIKMKLLKEAPPADPQPFVPPSPEGADSILKCFLKGFVFRTAMLHPDASYQTVVGKQNIAIHPASVLHGRKVEAIMFLENVFTQKNYAKKVSAVRADWMMGEWKTGV
ncbi:Salivary acidic proline-rich phosphoprotein 1/2 [Ceratocystis pirilliformis]|uniref:RNA helicase n=1 Tax=Ceratocystis pirilliformis TaxID=259994 RepID=A0ABR3ZG64_9PEZI